MTGDFQQRSTGERTMAWSQQARVTNLRLPGCRHAGPCNNCARWALSWREDVITAIRAAHN